MSPSGDDAVEQIVAAVLRHEDRLLLCHRHPGRKWYPNVWDLPGGHVELGESLPDALARELFEELGVVLQAPLGAPLHRVSLTASNAELMIWLIDHEGKVTNRAPEEHDELRWVTAAEIGLLLLAHDSYLDMLRSCLEMRTI